MEACKGGPKGGYKRTKRSWFKGTKEFGAQRAVGPNLCFFLFMVGQGASGINLNHLLD